MIFKGAVLGLQNYKQATFSIAITKGGGTIKEAMLHIYSLQRRWNYTAVIQQQAAIRGLVVRG